MANSRPLRLSGRDRIPTRNFLESTVASLVDKRRSSRLAQLNTVRTVQHQITTHQAVSTNLRTPLPNFIVDADSDTHYSEDEGESDSDAETNTSSSFEDFCPSSPEAEEFVALSSDSFEYMAGYDLGRRDSYDSRIEPGNEDYTLDDFVVDDDSLDEMSDAGSEITITSPSADTEYSWSAGIHLIDTENLSSTSSQSDGTDYSLFKSSSSRRSSAGSSSSKSSALFVTDDDDDEEYLNALSPDFETLFYQVGDDVDPADVAEEILDAACRFSRRCNRDSAPLRLELSRDCSEDDAVDEAMQFAVA
jgi:hypothetical protein